MEAWLLWKGLRVDRISNIKLKRNVQKKGELLTNVSFVCVAGNCEMLVYFSFFPNNSLNIGFEPYGVISWPQGAPIFVSNLYYK